MATSKKPLLFLVLLPLIFTQLTADPSPGNVETLSSEHGDSALKHEVDHLRSKISFLESSVDERIRELSGKDESVRQLETIIQEKSDTISSLKIEIEYFERKASLDDKEKMSNTHVQAAELEKQVDNVRKEIEMQNKKKVALEVRLNVAEEKIGELNVKLEDLQRINSEQKSKIQKAEHALQLAQEEMMKAKLRAASVSKALTEVHGEWLPHWLAVHLYHFQSLVSHWNELGRPALDITIQKAVEKKDQFKRWAEPHIRNVDMSFLVSHWNEHGRPALDITIQKALEKKDQLKRWAEPHIRNVNTHWIPVMKEEWSTFINRLEPLCQSLLSKSNEVYHASMNSMAPHVVKARTLTNPYIQEVKNFAEPYVNQVVMVTRLHYETMEVALKPYAKKMIHTYRKLVNSASLYHHQVQETLKSHELTRTLANMDLAWFLATAVLILPIIVLFQLFSVIFR
ncbi:Myosin heavy chain-related-like protein [Theobroma cacao]|uniref:Myosin heavy chain-related-like protein n=2 Tax=Theobroma cacao TaxID=3641 RepID=A0A061GR56_THECC|nr:Myosin heavy chain-related-like protein [Theobroma cacao]